MAKTNKKSKITTIKLEKNTKSRLDNLKEHHRESYDEVITKMLNIINITVRNPVAGARIFRNIKKRKTRKGEVYQGREKELESIETEEFEKESNEQEE